MTYINKFLAWWDQDVQSLSWEWIGHIALLLAAAGFAWFVWRIIFTHLVAISEKTHVEWDTIVLQSISAPISVSLFLGPSFYIIESFIKATTSININWLTVSHKIIFFGIFLWILFRLVNATEAYFMTSNKRDQTTVSAIGHILRLLLAFIGILTALQSFGLSFTGLATFGGVGGLVAGLAAKDLLSNFFGGLMIYFDRPFKVGDWIKSPDRDIQGTVERIGLRMTVIRSFESQPMYIPNSVFSSIVVQNPSRMQHRRIFETIGLRYKDTDKIKLVVADVKKMLETHPDIEQRAALMVNFDTFAGSSLNFFIYTFTKTVNWSKYNDVKQDVLLKIVDIVHQNGADFAFPTRTLAFDRDDAIAETTIEKQDTTATKPNN